MQNCHNCHRYWWSRASKYPSDIISINAACVYEDLQQLKIRTKPVNAEKEETQQVLKESKIEISENESVNKRAYSNGATNTTAKYLSIEN